MDLLNVIVRAIHTEARGVRSIELVAADPAEGLPAFEPGAHIDLHLPGDMARSYSLSNASAPDGPYVVTVGRDANSRGASAWLHDVLQPGTALRISVPRNHFPLVEDAAMSVLIAGGIGITPIRAMAQRLHELGRPWQLTYCCRDRESAAFVDALQAIGDASAMHFHFDLEAGGRMFDLAAAIHSAPPTAHFYCCGPLPMLAAFEDATRHLPPEQVHREYFTARAPVQRDGGFEVRLARAQRTLPVASGQSILDVLLDAGVDIEYSCMDGICGSCEVQVLAGTPDHRDQVLSDAQRAANKSLMVCCSRSKTPELVLDL